MVQPEVASKQVVIRRLFCSTVELKTVHCAHCRWKWQRLAVFRSSAEGKNTCQNIGGRQHRTTPACQILGVATLTPMVSISAYFAHRAEALGQEFLHRQVSIKPVMAQNCVSMTRIYHIKHKSNKKRIEYKYTTRMQTDLHVWQSS